MESFTFYVVSVSKYDPNSQTYQVQLRPAIYAASGSVTAQLNEFVLQVSATEAQAWQAVIGKTSQPVTLTF